MLGPRLGLICAALASAPAAGADFDLAFRRTDLLHPDEGANLYFGSGLAGGDFDGDGFGDIAVGEPGQQVVYLFPGSAAGVDPSKRETLSSRGQYPAGFFGGWLAALDTNADGFDDLAVGAGDSTSVFIYLGGVGGIAAASERFLEPVDATSGDVSGFGIPLAEGGDTDGDGYPELLITDQNWEGTDGFATGAVFVYPGGERGLDRCGERRLTVDDRPEIGFALLGNFAAGGGDLNGDGYGDISATCGACGDGGSVVVWPGGVNGVDLLPSMSIPNWGRLELVPDLDGDGYDELSVFGWQAGTWVYYGGPSGPDADHPQRHEAATNGNAGLGDVDGDELGDLLLSTYFQPEIVGIAFGDVTRPDDPPWLPLELAPDSVGDDGDNQGASVGDLNGDGRPDFAMASPLADWFEGNVSVFMPVCTWYADADGDGHGTASSTLDTCHDPGSGWAATATDCDDADADAQGAFWYPDGDGDGFGTDVGGALACTQPANTASVRHDCDDASPTIHPGAADSAEDGSDQDCDGQDGPWSVIDEDCDGEDTGEEAGDLDSGPLIDTSGEDTTGPRDAGCGCASKPGVGWTAALGVAMLARRRAQTPATPG